MMRGQHARGFGRAAGGEPLARGGQLHVDSLRRVRAAAARFSYCVAAWA